MDPIADPRWDEFVFSHHGASAYHLGAWAEINCRAYGARPRYLAAETPDGVLVGVLPLARSRGLVAGARLTSIPAARVAGPLGTTPQTETMLLRAAGARLGEYGARELIVRSFTGSYRAELAELSRADDQPTWVLELPGTPEELPGCLHAGKRIARSVRKAGRAGVTVRETSEPADLRAFYALYLETMRKHRSLPRRLTQLETSRQLLAGSGVYRLFVSELDRKIVAGGVFHLFGERLELLYNASDPRALDVQPNHALYWHAIEWAIVRGLRGFDFGGALPGTSLGEFKRQWGAEPVPIYRYTLRPGSPGGEEPAPPPRAVGEGDSIVARAWQRAPLKLTRAAGAVAYRYL